jgi:hypothetical protein
MWAFTYSGRYQPLCSSPKPRAPRIKTIPQNDHTTDLVIDARLLIQVGSPVQVTVQADDGHTDPTGLSVCGAHAYERRLRSMGPDDAHCLSSRWAGPISAAKRQTSPTKEKRISNIRTEAWAPTCPQPAC